MAIRVPYNMHAMYVRRGWTTSAKIPEMMFCSLLIRCGIKAAQEMWDQRAMVGGPMVPDKSISEQEAVAKGGPLQHFFDELGY